MHRDLGLDETPRCHISVGLLRLPSGECTALVDVAFPDLGSIVSLPTFARVSGPQRLYSAQVSVRVANGTRLRTLEVVPTHLPHKSSEFVSEPANRKRHYWRDLDDSGK
jgi:hypothetical protein